ncbi:hypothetical protein SAMN05216516_1168 [Izhakiella capsodis]|uniref:Uncharacterized protein n=1 Tax=Izhakiella capsodis TaxID=1367852 RepID=A0A1I5BCC5_9GAMM|nr:hypothetical protein SAMN05216516_1168 [Izhakiella capsodis]
MNKAAIYIVKTLLSSCATVTICICAFLIAFIIRAWIGESISLSDNVLLLRITIPLSLISVSLIMICMCLNFYLNILTDTRDSKVRNNSAELEKTSRNVRVDEVKF